MRSPLRVYGCERLAESLCKVRSDGFSLILRGPLSSTTVWNTIPRAAVNGRSRATFSGDSLRMRRQLWHKCEIAPRLDAFSLKEIAWATRLSVATC